MIPQSFEVAVEAWRAAQFKAAEARLAFERAHAEALIRADGRTAEVREAQAKLAAARSRLEYEMFQIEAKALEHWVIFLRAPRPIAGMHGTVDPTDAEFPL